MLENQYRSLAGDPSDLSVDEFIHNQIGHYQHA